MKKKHLSRKTILVILLIILLFGTSIIALTVKDTTYTEISGRLFGRHPRLKKVIKKTVILKSIKEIAKTDTETQTQTKTENDFPLLSSNDLIYQGAFRMPYIPYDKEDYEAGRTFQYGGTAITYNPKKNSLYIVGHDWQQLAAEISIPEIVNSQNLDSLKRAELLQSFADASDGLKYTIDDSNIKSGGFLIDNNRLIGSEYVYYDADGDATLSHFTSPLNLSGTNDAQGMYQLGTLGAGFVAGYMAKIPSEWESSLGGTSLTGLCCVAIISRSSYGPAAFVFNPADLGVKNPVPVTPLVYYPSSNPTLGDWDETNPYFNGSTIMGGLVLPVNTRSLLFFGRHGIGEFCYGTGEECGDPANSSKGTHVYPYVYQVWAYDVLDLIDVKNGLKNPWDVKPVIWNFDLPFSSENKVLGGAAYDSKTNRIFISQIYGDGANPVIHVFSVK